MMAGSTGSPHRERSRSRSRRPAKLLPLRRFQDGPQEEAGRAGASWCKLLWGVGQCEARKVRVKAERRAQLTEKQRKRGGNAVRTTQINFRCSPAFRELAAGLAKHLECSIADVMEEALDMLASAKGYAKGR
jgi:hypothetical protein